MAHLASWSVGDEPAARRFETYPAPVGHSRSSFVDRLLEALRSSGIEDMAEALVNQWRLRSGISVSSNPSKTAIVQVHQWRRQYP